MPFFPAGMSTIGKIGAGVGLAGDIAGIAGGLFGGGKDKTAFYEGRRQYNENLKFAKQQYYHQVEDRVRDAKNAGVHPVYALGGSSAQFSPGIAVTGLQDKESVGQRLQKAGAGISRAAEAMATERERLGNRLLESQIEGQEIANAKAASDARIATQSAPPAKAEALPSQSISAAPDHEGVEAADTPFWKLKKLGMGEEILIPSQSSIEELGFPMDMIKSAELLWKTAGAADKRWLDKKLKKRGYSYDRKKGYWRNFGKLFKRRKK